jgi:acyl-coenzyme A synthetase/AMP-(fatty) acid ligase
MKLLANIQSFAHAHPDSPSISTGGSSSETLTYRQLAASVSSIVRTVSSRANDADFLFVIANRSPNLVCSIVAGLSSGTPVAIIDPRLGLHRIAHVLSRAKKCIGLVDKLGESVLSKLPAEQLTNVTYWSLESMGESGNSDPVLLDFTSVAEPDSQAAVILFTSGSTGNPKGVQISYRDLDSRLDSEIDWFEMTAFDRILGVLPLSFDVGLTQLLGTLYCGAHHILLTSWLAKDILGHIDRLSPHGLALSPVVWKNLLNVSDKPELWKAINSLRYVTLSGGTLADDELRIIADGLDKCGLIKTYGQTEMFRISSLKLNSHPNKLTSVGRAYPGVQLDVVNDRGESCAPDEIGEIVAGGAGRMIGYLGQDSVAQESDSTGMIRTGDFGMLDQDGFLHIEGRKDDMLKVLDQRIYPNDIASSIREITGISEVVVILVEIDGGQAFVAFLKKEQPAESFGDEKAISRTLRQQLPYHLVPRHFIELDEFPCTISGKIDKIALREILNRFCEEQNSDSDQGR